MKDLDGTRRSYSDATWSSAQVAEPLFRYAAGNGDDVRLDRRGFVHLSPEELAETIGNEVSGSALRSLRASWERLPTDAYMNDGGRYRLRRHAVLSACEGEVKRLPYRPHFQSRAYNDLNGGVQRYYSEIETRVIENPLLQGCLRLALDSVGGYFEAACWYIELHQFRIVARAGEEGRPTPEGMHRDGVERVLMVLMGRDNVDGGLSRIHAPDGHLLEERCMTQPLEAMLVDDAAVRHAVTPVRVRDASREGVRDMLVITLRRVAKNLPV